LTQGSEAGPRGQLPRRGEPAHVHSNLGDDRGGDRTDAGYLLEPRRGVNERGQLILDMGVDVVDVGGDRVHPGEHFGQ
jgi:hypothetical protein